MLVVRWLVITFWMVIASYAGVAGYFACKAVENTSISTADQYVEYEGLSFENKESLQEFLHDSEGANLFPWIFALPQEFAPVIACVAFGLLGGTVGLLENIVIEHSPISSLSVYTKPLFSAVIGPMLYLLSFLIPAIFVVGRNPARAATLVVLSFFGGAFSEQAYPWIREQTIEKLFPSKTRKRSGKASRNDS